MGQGPIGAYGTQAPLAPQLTSQAWQQSAAIPWYSDPIKRPIIRFFSRGVVGAAAFTAAGIMTPKLMKGYSPYKSFAELQPFAQEGGILKTIAKSIDTFAGIPLKRVIRLFNGDNAEKTLRFRATKYHGYESPSGMKDMIAGQSWGEYIVNFTNDFFWMSVADAATRDLVACFDPNVKKSWRDENGNFTAIGAAKGFGKAWGRYLIYNGGEDWATAFGYAGWMKASHYLINRHWSRGFENDAHVSLNGGSFKVQDSKVSIAPPAMLPAGTNISVATHTPAISGNNNKEGMVDLILRFMAYNGAFIPGTLHFRELYNYVGNKLSGKQDSLYGAPDDDKAKTLMERITYVPKWIIRGMVKGVITMLPATPVFALLRTPQTKHRGMFIHQDHGALGYFVDNEWKALHANVPNLTGEQELYYRKPDPAMHGPATDRYHYTYAGKVDQFADGMLGRQRANNGGRNEFGAYKQSFGPFDSLLNAVGWTNYKMGRYLDKPAEWADKYGGPLGEKLKETIGIEPSVIDGKRKFERFTRPWIYAALSYYPYMYLKGETALLWDTGKMDVATERMIDGAFSFNWKEFKAGAQEVGYAIAHKPFADPAREAQAQHRMRLDTSAPDVFNQTQQQMQEERENDLPRWQDRVISGKSNVVEDTPGDGASLENTYRIARRSPSDIKPRGPVERKELRDALNKLSPPTNSIH